MQNVTRIALGLGAAAVVASGGSAFTASSNVSESGTRLGYGAHTVTGVIVNNIEYLAGAVNTISHVRFTVPDGADTGNAALTALDIASMSLTLSSPGATPVVADPDCAVTGSGRTITCKTHADTPVTANAIESVHLNVKPR